MIRRAVGTLLIAILAALTWAPLTVYASASNSLLGASVSPSSGTTETTFVLSVTYQSTTATAAGSVTVTVAGYVLPMQLTAGTMTNGTWSASVRLPAGTWMPYFAASPAKGPKPTLYGTLVTVVDLLISTPTPTPTASPTSSATSKASVNPIVVPDPSTTSLVPAPTAAAQPSASSAGTATSASPSVAGSGSEATAASPPSGVRSTAPGGGAPRATASPRTGGGAPTATSGLRASDASGIGIGVGPEDVLPGGLSQGGLLALLAGALVALLAAFFILFGGRRSDHHRPATIATGLPPVARDRERVTDAEERADAVDAAMAARTARRSRIQPADDPILRAMGIGPDAATPVRRTGAGATRRVEQGPVTRRRPGAPPESDD